MNVTPTPSPLIDAPTLMVTPIDMIDSNKSFTRKSSSRHVPNNATLISDLVFNLSILSMPLCLASARS